MLVFSVAITVGAALLFSLAPMLRPPPRGFQGCLNAGGRGASDGPRRGARARRLPDGAGLYAAGRRRSAVRSFENLPCRPRVQRAERGHFGHLPSILTLSGSRGSETVLQTLGRSSPTRPASSAGVLCLFVYRPKLWLTHAWADGSSPADGEEPVVFFKLVAGDYFKAMGIPLKRGRWPDAREMWDEPRGVVVNEALAKQLFPDGQALGRGLRSERTGPAREIIGIVGDVRQKRLDEPPKPELYTTFASMPMPFMTIVVRTSSDPAPMLDVIRGVVRRRDPGLAIANLPPLAAYVDAHTADRRFALMLLAMFGALAVSLGAIGVYGVMSYAVEQRQREIAIRALGATARGVRSIVVLDALKSCSSALPPVWPSPLWPRASWAACCLRVSGRSADPYGSAGRAGDGGDHREAPARRAPRGSTRSDRFEANDSCEETRCLRDAIAGWRPSAWPRPPPCCLPWPHPRTTGEIIGTVTDPRPQCCLVLR